MTLPEIQQAQDDIDNAYVRMNAVIAEQLRTRTPETITLDGAVLTRGDISDVEEEFGILDTIFYDEPEFLHSLVFQCRYYKDTDELLYGINNPFSNMWWQGDTMEAAWEQMKTDLREHRTRNAWLEEVLRTT